MNLISELKSKAPEECPRVKGFYLRNNDTGEIIPSRCKCYDCEYCGWRKGVRLQKALEDYFKSYEHIRLFTFTFRNNYDTDKLADPKFQLYITRKCNEVWRRFINNIRRLPESAKYMREFKYVKVLEFTKKGFPHFHVLVDRFLCIRTFTKFWRRAVNQVFKKTGINGGINIRHSLNARGASRYVAKYVLKSAIDISTMRKKYRLWSKSAGVTIFPIREKLETWVFLDMRKIPLNSSEYRITSRLDETTGEILEFG